MIGEARVEENHRPIRPKRYAKPRAIGAYSSAGAMAKVDGRSKEALFMQRLRKELLAHVGGSPSATQRLLVERAVRLSMQVELMDERFFKDGELSDRNNRQLLAWSNALTRTLSKLGINPTKPKVPALTTIIGVNGAGRLASSMGSRP